MLSYLFTAFLDEVPKVDVKEIINHEKVVIDLGPRVSLHLPSFEAAKALGVAIVKAAIKEEAERARMRGDALHDVPASVVNEAIPF